MKTLPKGPAILRMKLSTLILVVPLAVLAALIALANRGMVRFSLDPFSASHPAVAWQLPLYLLIFLVFLAGVLLGGAAVMLGRRARARRRANSGRALAVAGPNPEAGP